VCTQPVVVEVTALTIVHWHAKLDLTGSHESTSWLDRPVEMPN